MLRSSLSCVALCLLVAMVNSQGIFVFADANHGSCSEAAESQPTPSTMVGSVSDISEALTRETDRVFETALVRRSATFKSLVGTQSVGLWNELILRPGNDLALPIVGLMCIEQERPELAFDAAVRCIILSSRPGNPLMGYPAEILQKGARERKSADRIAHILESGAGSDDSVALLVTALTRVDLIACFDALDLEQCAASRLAWIVSEIASDGLGELDEKTKSKYQSALASLAAVPGIPRCEYLCLVDEQAKNVKECLRLAILDPDVKQMLLIPALRRFGKEYSKDIGAWIESAPEERRIFVRKYIPR